MKNKKPKHYCSNADLMKELWIYHDTDVITEELGKMLMEIATRFTNRPNWVGYPQEMKNDLVSEALLRMISQIHKFDLNRVSYTYIIPDPKELNETGELITSCGKSVSIINGDETTIDNKVYKRVDYKLINVKDETDYYSLRKPNPFSYFSQICFHKYIMEAKKYYKQINIQRDLCEQYIEEIECNEHMDSNGFLKKALSERVNELG